MVSLEGVGSTVVVGGSSVIGNLGKVHHVREVSLNLDLHSIEEVSEKSSIFAVGLSFSHKIGRKFAELGLKSLEFFLLLVLLLFSCNSGFLLLSLESSLLISGCLLGFSCSLSSSSSFFSLCDSVSVRLVGRLDLLHSWLSLASLFLASSVASFTSALGFFRSAKANISVVEDWILRLVFLSLFIRGGRVLVSIA